jgi:hypothetical protein
MDASAFDQIEDAGGYAVDLGYLVTLGILDRYA